MWKALIRSAIVGGIIVFLWLMFSWAVLPFHKMTIKQFRNPSEVEQTVMQGTSRDGIYVVPSWDETAASKSEMKRPFIFVNVVKNANFGNMNASLISSFITQVIGAFIVTALLLFHTKTMHYWKRVWFVTLAGTFVAIVGMWPFWTWWSFPCGFVFLGMIDYVIGWFLGGLVIAKLSKK